MRIRDWIAWIPFSCICLTRTEFAKPGRSTTLIIRRMDQYTVVCVQPKPKSKEVGSGGTTAHPRQSSLGCCEQTWPIISYLSVAYLYTQVGSFSPSYAPVVRTFPSSSEPGCYAAIKLETTTRETNPDHLVRTTTLFASSNSTGHRHGKPPHYAAQYSSLYSRHTKPTPPLPVRTPLHISFAQPKNLPPFAKSKKMKTHFTIARPKSIIGNDYFFYF